MRLLGYTRISTAGQDAQLQRDALTDAGVELRDIFSKITSGSKAAISRPGMQRLIDYAEAAKLVGWSRATPYRHQAAPSKCRRQLPINTN